VERDDDVKIKEVVDLLGIENEYNVPFHFLSEDLLVNSHHRSSIVSTQYGVVCGENETIWSVGLLEGREEQVNLIKTDIQRCITDLDDRDMDKYMAIMQILLAVDVFQEGSGRVELRKAKDYVGQIDHEIKVALDFHEIQEMKDLIRLIRADRLCSQLCFQVSVIAGGKGEQNLKKENLSFGNTKYCEALDLVYITIYEDCFELYCLKEGTSRESRFEGTKAYTLEDRILYALFDWKNAV
jgi:hypothetical protein